MKFLFSFGMLFIFSHAEASFDCHNIEMDVALVIPSKDNVQDDYEMMLDSIGELIKQFSVLRNSSHFAIIQYGKNAKVSVTMTDLSKDDKRLWKKLEEVIRNLRDKSTDLGIGSNISNALKTVAEDVFNEDNDLRPTSIDLVILVARELVVDDDTERVIKDLEGRGIYRLAVEVGNKFPIENLRNLTGGRNEEILQYRDFSDLKENVTNIHNTTCGMLDCEDPPLDICLVIDQTQSVGVENYKTMLKAVINFVGFFNVGIKDTRIAIVSFASDAKKRIGFSDSAYQSLEKLTEYLTSMFNDALGRPTRTDRALEKAIQVLKDGDANHQGVLMVLTDGKTNPKSRDLGEVMKELSTLDRGIHRIAVGVGRRRLNITQLKQIAGEHNDDGVILMENFEDLHHKIRKLREVTCSINGGFSEWSSWSECSASCGGGVHGRERTCTSPPPRHAGKDCKGESFETRTCNNEECVCERKIDLGLLIDSSESITEQPLENLLQNFLPEFLRTQFTRGTIGRNGTRVGVVKFDHKTSILVDFNDKRSYMRNELVEMLENTSSNVVFETRFDKALEEVSTSLFSAKGGERTDFPNVLVIFTDGKPFPRDEVKPFNVTLPPLRRDKKVHIIFVAYGPPQKINYTNLERLAAPEKLIILPSTKQEYESMSTLRKLRMAVCAEPGGYTDWSAWGECSVTCGGGFQSRKRSCTNPPASHGGLNCKAQKLGPAEEERACNNKQDCS